jgi:hypothetical protein
MVKSSFDTEDIYAMRILAFEKEMARKKLRPPLPIRGGGYKYHKLMWPAVVAQREEQSKVRAEMYESIISSIADGEAIDIASLGARMKATPYKVANYVKLMVEQGYLNKLTLASGKLTYLYMKTGKALDEGDVDPALSDDGAAVEALYKGAKLAGLV